MPICTFHAQTTRIKDKDNQNAKCATKTKVATANQQPTLQFDQPRDHQASASTVRAKFGCIFKTNAA